MQKRFVILILALLIIGCDEDIKFEIPEEFLEKEPVALVDDEGNEIPVEKEPFEEQTTHIKKVDDGIIIEGKTLEQRKVLVEKRLHYTGSGDEAKRLFPDFEVIYIDSNNENFPDEILPFTYYYSEEADFTVSICNQDLTVFICPGKLSSLIQESDFNRCKVTSEYLFELKYG